MKNCMNTYTGMVFDPMHMTPDHVRSEDIAHALSLLCRGGGHVRYFYSVGQHSINCAREAAARGYSGRVVLACLLHDASEAYISDIIRPVKVHLENYMEIEAMMMEAVLIHFGIGAMSEKERENVRQIDDEILLYELHELMPGSRVERLPKLISAPDFTKQPVEAVEETFLMMLKEWREICTSEL